MGYLTGPVHTLTDFQVEFNGLLMGPGTPYGLPPLWDFLDLGPVRAMDVARVFGDGAWSGPDYSDVVTPAMDVEVSAPDPVSFAAAVQAFINAFGISPTPRGLWYKLPNMPAMGIPAKSNKRVVPIDLSWGQLSTASLQGRSTDAVWQSVPRTASLLSSASQIAGMVFPLFSDADGSTPGVEHVWNGAANNSTSSEYAGSTVRTNYITNPNFEAGGAYNWGTNGSGSGASAVASQDRAHSGSYSMKVTGGNGQNEGTYSVPTGMPAGATVTFSAWVYVPSSGGLLNPVVALGGTGFATAPIAARDTWTRVSVSGTVQSSGSVTVYVYDGGQPAAGANAGKILYVDDAMLEVAPAMGTYFDGSTPNTVGGAIDFGVTSAGSNSATIVNAGNTDAWITALVTGPCPGGFTLALNGHAVTYGTTVPSGQTVLVDYAAATATLTGGVDRTVNLTADDFTAVAGTSSSTPTTATVVFTATSGTALITTADRQR